MILGVIRVDDCMICVLVNDCESEGIITITLSGKRWTAKNLDKGN